jgi:putative redox protein
LATRVVEVQIDQVGPSTGQAVVRSHTVLVDRPVAKEGADRGPMGGEYLLVALGGCFLSTLLAAIRTRGAGVSDVRVTARGTIDGVPERFTAIALHVAANYEDEDEMRKLLLVAERGCLVTNTLKDALTLSVVLESEA